MRQLSTALLLGVVACLPFEPDGGTGGGSGGGGTPPRVAKVRITNVTGSYSGTAVHTMGSTTDRMENCQASITAGMSDTTHEVRLTQNGVRSLLGARVDVTSDACNGTHTTTSDSTPCTAPGATATGLTNFIIYANVESWSETATVQLELVTLPTGLPSCNLASFVGQFESKFTTTAPLGSFLGGTPFDLNFSGSTSVQTNATTSSTWMYDVTATVTPVD